MCVAVCVVVCISRKIGPVTVSRPRHYTVHQKIGSLGPKDQLWGIVGNVKFFGPKIFLGRTIFLGANKFLGLNIFLGQNKILGKKIFLGPKHFLGQQKNIWGEKKNCGWKLFWSKDAPKIFLAQKFVFPKKIVGLNFFFPPKNVCARKLKKKNLAGKNLWTPKFFWAQNKFWAPQNFWACCHPRTGDPHGVTQKKLSRFG